MTIILARDVTHSNLPSLGGWKGQVALYDTGSGGIAASAADYAAHPGAIHIDQDANAGDATADILDVETGAATPAEVPGWLDRARAAFRAGRRPGQRWPGVYVNGSNLTTVANAVMAAGVGVPVPIWLAEWNGNESADAAQIANTSGNFPLIGIQFMNNGTYDSDIFSSAWLNNQSGGPVATPTSTDYNIAAPPPGWYKGGTPVITFGTGTDGNVYVTFTVGGKSWSSPIKVAS